MWLRPSGLSGPRRSEWKTSVPVSPAGNGPTAEGTADVCPSSVVVLNSRAAASKRPVITTSLDVRLGRCGLANREIRRIRRARPSASAIQTTSAGQVRPITRVQRVARRCPISAMRRRGHAVEQRHFDAVVLGEHAVRPVHRRRPPRSSPRRSAPGRAGRAGRTRPAVRRRSPCSPAAAANNRPGRKPSDSKNPPVPARP